jgi:acid phosphatase family membrane protein YuiD
MAPVIGWLFSGTVKFMVNWIRYGKEAKARIGNGGFPSTHTTIMMTTTMLIGFGEGFDDPLFGLGFAITFIIIMDATGLRFTVGKHAAHLNQILRIRDFASSEQLRESMGHTKFEVLGGAVLGIMLGYLLNEISHSWGYWGI